MYEQSTDFVGGISSDEDPCIHRPNIKHPPTASVVFRTFCAKLVEMQFNGLIRWV